MHILCRDSLKNYLSRISEDYFRILTTAQNFSNSLKPQEIPHLQLVLCPDLAVKSVSRGHCLLLNDSYVEKSEYVTDYDRQIGYH